MNKTNLPVIIDKNTENVLPVFSITYDENGKALEAEVWLHDDICILQDGEFEIVERGQIRI